MDSKEFFCRVIKERLSGQDFRELSKSVEPQNVYWSRACETISNWEGEFLSIVQPTDPAKAESECHRLKYQLRNILKIDRNVTAHADIILDSLLSISLACNFSDYENQRSGLLADRKKGSPYTSILQNPTKVNRRALFLLLGIISTSIFFELLVKRGDINMPSPINSSGSSFPVKIYPFDSSSSSILVPSVNQALKDVTPLGEQLAIKRTLEKQRNFVCARFINEADYSDGLGTYYKIAQKGTKTYYAAATSHYPKSHPQHCWFDHNPLATLVGALEPVWIEFGRQYESTNNDVFGCFIFIPELDKSRMIITTVTKLGCAAVPFENNIVLSRNTSRM